MRITLNGYVSADEDLWLYDWYGFPAFGPGTVRQAIADNPSGEELVIEVNSYGGSVWAGAEIYSVLRSAEIPTRAEIQSLAASAASYLVAGCDEVWISPVAEMMLHLPSTVTEGDRNAHRNGIHLLDSIETSILNAYELKSAGKKTRDELSRMMHNETWLTAQDALDAGLVDGILYQDDLSPKTIVNAAGGGLKALAGICGVPDIAKLRDEYLKAHPPAGEPPAANTSTDWQETARKRLLIEQNRFTNGGMNNA